MRGKIICSRNILLCAAAGILWGVAAAPAGAQIVTEVLRLGEDDQWAAVREFSNTRLVAGWRGGMEIVLDHRHDSADDDTDLLLTFDGVVRDAALRYTVRSGGDLVVSAPRLRGTGALGLDGRHVLALEPGPSSLFAPGSQVHSFSMDLWFHPHQIIEGAELLRWRGTFLENGQPTLQEVRLEVHNRRLRWVLHNVVVQPDGTGTLHPRSVTLEARRPLVPRVWQHHQLQFDSSTGRIAYHVDEQPEAIQYLTVSGREDGTAQSLHFGHDTGEGLVVGRGVYGVVDELRITRRANQDHTPVAFSRDPGRVTSDPVYLGGSGAAVQRITVEARTPGRTEIRGEYRVADHVVHRDPHRALAEPWRAIPENGVIPGDQRGRFLQVRFDFLADAALRESPSLQDVVIHYLPALPPPPTRRVTGSPVPGGVSLEWLPVVHEDIAGYRVHLGEYPGRFTGVPGIAGPVDAGMDTQVEITGLTPDVPYVFAVETYDRFGQPSALSREVEVRAGRNGEP